ncbi:MAG TPA: tRNA pseudouridine(55) synthase TruB [Thermoanaerobaculia bacterium]|jgi:tRNA pseudouridine55 synthase|nr:tRNA pseudouridine(55) synthase TruB [Thermoanaerobaculia bacterium]
MVDGLLLVDKQAGCTSHDVVQQVRRLMRQRRIGHCGTLDPDATGLLLLTLGQATRLTRFLIRAPKEYEGRLRLGIATDTYDASGRPTAERSTAGVEESHLGREMRAFVGSYAQVPPPYCAKKIGGEKYYELARRGEATPDEPKEVEIYAFEPAGPLADDRLAFRLACESGTYARSLVHDLGERLGCGAHLERLRRTRIGPFALDDALPVATLGERRAAEAPLGPAWLPLAEIPLPFATTVADAAQERRLLHGQTILTRQLDGMEGDWVRIADRRGRLLAIGSVVERLGGSGMVVIQPKIVFPAPALC